MNRETIVRTPAPAERPVRGAGFTLIELLIVVAIIAVLAAIAVPNFLEAQTRAKISRTMNDMRTVGLALDSYFIDFNEFPNWVTPEEKQTVGFMADWLMIIPGNRRYLGELLTTPLAYLTTVPIDPFMSAIPPGRQSFPGHDVQASFVVSIQLITNAKPITGNIIPENYALRQMRWLLESPGPDNLWWEGDRNAFLYDPTNGTVSRGQIALTDAGWITPVNP